MSDVIDRSIRVKRLLEDEAVVWALAELDKENYERFVKADTDEERRQAQARAQVTRIFGTLLQAIVDAGERETIQRDRAERLSGDSPK